jgi:hypothetical protein
MLVAMLFGALVSQLIGGTVAHPDCKKSEFKAPRCESAKVLDDAGEAIKKL